MLRRVRGLHVAARRGRGLDLQQSGPEFGVAAQRRHHDRVALGAFGVPLPRVVLLEDGVMYDGRRHAADYARSPLRGQTNGMSMESVREGLKSSPRRAADFAAMPTKT